MACNNCYNGCVETTSDKCVRYTGENVTSLAIENGDNLFTVEQALINTIVSFLDGTGIKINIPIGDYCTLVTQYLPPCFPACGNPSAKELFTALVKAACNLQTQVTSINGTLTTLNANYTIGCLTGVTASSDTHDIVQAVITKLCQLGVDLAALSLDVSTNYVKIADLNGLIAAYLASVAPAVTPYYTRMVPFTVMEYYGGLSGNFDVNGVGIGPWQQIYLCNGLNGTPDKRGRVGVGAIVGVGGGALNPAVDPSNPSNPNYALNLATGANTVTLSATQIPAHTHSVTLTDPGHHHFVAGSDTTASASPINATTPIASGGSAGTNTAYELHPSVLSATVGKTSTSFTGVNATIGSTGGGLSHANIQPSIACYYIMYIPNP